MTLEAGAPVDGNTLSRARTDGPALYWRNHATEVALKVGLPRVGRTKTGPLLPIASVEAGFHSASVTFYRWRKKDIPADGTLSAETTQRWLVVPILLRPDRVLENEQFSDYLEEKNPRYKAINAVIAAGDTLQEMHPGGRWHMHPVREHSERVKDRKVRTRIYALASDESSPDVELVVKDANREGPASVVAHNVVHSPAAWTTPEIQLSLRGPTAMTVARVLSRGLMAQKVMAVGSDGSHWSIDAETGAIERKDLSPEELEDSKDEATGRLKISGEAKLDVSVGEAPAPEPTSEPAPKVESDTAADPN